MKTTEKIIIASVVGTTFMTLYSYLKAKKEKQEYVEPVMLNKLIDNSENLPEIDDNNSHPAGWGLHYATGVAFMAGYYLLWKKMLEKPGATNTAIAGIASGAVGVAVWKALFTQHKNPPQNYRYGYYRQLLTAHIIFTVVGVATYKLLGDTKPHSS